MRICPNRKVCIYHAETPIRRQNQLSDLPAEVVVDFEGVFRAILELFKMITKLAVMAVTSQVLCSPEKYCTRISNLSMHGKSQGVCESITIDHKRRAVTNRGQ